MTENFYFWAYKSLKTFLLGCLFISWTNDVHSKSWRDKAKRYLKVNFDRTRSKVNFYIENKYLLPSDYFHLREQIATISQSSEEYFTNCRVNQKESRCKLSSSDFNEVLGQSSSLVSAFLKNLPKKNHFKDFLGESILLHLLVLTQEKAVNVSQAVDISLELESLITQYLYNQIPRESFDHINDYYTTFDKVRNKIQSLDSSKMQKITNTVNYFIRKERESTNISSSSKKSLELINLFWNNVLKIKKDQR